MGKITYDCLEEYEYILRTQSTQIITWPQDTPSIAVQSLSHVWPYGLQNARFLCSLLFSGVCSNSCPSSQWCHPTILFSASPFSFCLQSFPAAVSFPVGWFFASEGQSIGASASASVLPMNMQGWIPLRLTGLISLQSKGLSDPAPQFESINFLALSLLYGTTLTSTHNYWKVHSFDHTHLCWQSDVSAFNML